MRIGDIACGRAGDKADVLDLTLVACDDRDYERLARVVTAEFAARALPCPAPSCATSCPGCAR